MSDKEAQILKASIQLFYEKGYAAVGVDEIGAAAGLTGPAIYRHFKNKSAILVALFDQAIDGILSATRPSTADPAEDLEHRAYAHARFVIQQHKLASVWIREGRSLTPEDRVRLRRREINYLRQWQECVQRRFPEARQEDVETATLCAVGVLNSVSNWPHNTSPPEKLVGGLAEFTLQGLEWLAQADRS